MSRVRELDVWLRGRKVAVLRRTGPGGISCQYTDEVLDTHQTGAPLLSCSLPVRRDRQPAWPFVTGLLPEGQHRTSMSRLAGVDTLDALGMLARFGRDVAGALVIGHADTAISGTSTGASSSRGEPGVLPLTDADLLDEVAGLPAQSLGLHEDSELSLAGLEDKILLVRTVDGWARPVHGYPSTHILKVDNRLHRGVVLLEHDCLELARLAGLPAPPSSLLRIGDADCIVVERYDRTRGGDGTIVRVHQEDTCQALGIDPAAQHGRAKYETHGGPTLVRIAELLNAYSPDPTGQLRALLERVTFTVVIGDADAHGKNISLLHPDEQHVTLAPLYDIVPTALWPTLRPTAALRINGRDELPGVTADDLVREARRWGLSERIAAQTVSDVCDRLRTASTGLPERPGRDLRRLVSANLNRLRAA
jgi:serine/threonine-protein kinase HipA